MLLNQLPKETVQDTFYDKQCGHNIKLCFFACMSKGFEHSRNVCLWQWSVFKIYNHVVLSECNTPAIKIRD